MSTVSWQVVSTTAAKRKLVFSPNGDKPKTTRISNETSSENQFQILQDHEEMDVTPNTSGEDKTPKPPPIFIPHVVDITKMIESLRSFLPNDEFAYKSLRDGQVRVITTKAESYRKIVDFLNKNNTMYHSYQLKQQRAYRVVIKNLHQSTPINDIKSELAGFGYVARNITNVRSRITKEQLPIFFVDLEPDENNKTIYEIKYLANAVVRVEPPRVFNDIVQCHRCQQYGHTQNYCKKGFRCVKCGLDHASKDCKKTLETPPRCIHCLENHTANYKGCQIYQQLITKKNIAVQRKRNNSQMLTENNPFFESNNQNLRNENMSYAQVTRTNQEQQSQEKFMQKIESLINKQVELTNTLINMMSNLINKLCK